MTAPEPFFDSDVALQEDLAALAADGHLRSCLVVDPMVSALGVPRTGLERVLATGEQVIDLCSNDYLGLAAHPSVRGAAAEAALAYGVGARSSRLVSGTSSLHVQLEAVLAAWCQKPAALLFGSGYLAHVGTIPALVGRDDVIFSDALNHASIVDGARLSRAQVEIFRHRDLNHLGELLAGSAASGRARRRLVISETIFSMDGDEADVVGLRVLAERHQAWLLLDEAHALGVRGHNGGGLAVQTGQSDGVTAILGTLGKAVGTYGAFVAGSAALIETLVNRARSVIYSTALPLPVVAATEVAVAIAQGAFGIGARTGLASAARALRQGLVALGFEVPAVRGPILPLIVGDARRAVALAERLLAHGVLCRAIRYPTVPRGSERLRLVVTAAVDAAASAHILDVFARSM